MTRTTITMLAAALLVGCGAAEGPARRTGVAVEGVPVTPPSAHQDLSAEQQAEQRREQRCDGYARRAADHGMDAGAVAALTGTYAPANDPTSLRRWSVDLVCDGRVLRAIPLWGDVAPPWLRATGARAFDDEWGVRWSFRTDPGGEASGVELAAPGEQAVLYTRIGPPQEIR